MSAKPIECNGCNHRAKNSLLFAIILVACVITAEACGTSTYQMQAFHLPPAAHRMGGVVAVAQHDEIVAFPEQDQKVLIASGLKPTEMPGGSLAAAIVYCCGGPAEKSDAFFFYVPPPTRVEVGDFAEVEMGRPSDHDDPGTVNTLVRVRQKKDATNEACRWDPPEPHFWMRIIYCKWMPQEGWVEQTGLYKTWYKPPGRN
jgi:hypothetical protein